MTDEVCEALLETKTSQEFGKCFIKLMGKHPETISDLERDEVIAHFFKLHNEAREKYVIGTKSNGEKIYISPGIGHVKPEFLKSKESD